MPTSEDELASHAQQRVGTLLRGKYRIDRVIGDGGMAVVYKATHRNQAEFAVKMLRPELSVREDIRTRFLREGYAANSVKHPGAVAVVDDDVAEDGAAFLVMELLSGLPVDALWERGGRRLPLRAVIAVGYQLLDVLAAAHDKGIVHRDIKPPNLFVTTDGTLKVLDFGIARVKEVTGSLGSGDRTGTGMLLGTPAYMSPEQAYAKSGEIDGQTDLWAVGATLFTLLTGRPVHDGENAVQIMVQAATVPARPLAGVAPAVPPSVAAVIDRALAFEKADRWQTATDMREALGEASLEALGEKPSKAVLEALLRGDVDVDEHDATEAQAFLPTSLASSGVAVRVATGAPQGITKSLAVGSTAQPVSSDPSPDRAAPRGRGRMTGAIVVASVLVVGGVLAAQGRHGSRQEPAAAASPVTTATPGPAASAAALSPGLPVATASATSAPETASSTAPEAASSTGPVEPPATKPAKSVKGVATQPSQAHTPAPTPPPPAKHPGNANPLDIPMQ